MGGDALERALCKDVPSEPKNYEEESRLKIEDLINTQMQAYRSLILQTNADMVRGVGFGEDGLCTRVTG